MTPTNQFSLKLFPSTSYNFSLSWGDGTSEIFNQTTSSVEASAQLLHTYSTPGSYKISIYENVRGGFPGVFYNDTSSSLNFYDSLKITDIMQWGTPLWTRMDLSFAGCKNLSGFAEDTSSFFTSVTSFYRTFFNCKIPGVPFLNTVNCVNHNACLYNCNLSSYPLINTSNSQNLEYFINSNTVSSSVSGELPYYDLSKAINLNYAFSTMRGVTSINPRLSSFPEATSVQYLFYDLWKLAVLPKEMVFSKAPSLFNIFSNTIGQYSNFLELPFITAPLATSVNFMSYNCGARKTNGFNFPRVTSYDRAFASMPNLTSFSYFDASSALALTYTWAGCQKLTTLPVLSTQNVTNFTNALNYCTELRENPFLHTSSGLNFSSTWRGCTLLSSFPMIDTSKGTNFSYTWEDTVSLSAIDFPTLNMSRMTNGTSCFKGVTLKTTSYSALLTSLCALNTNNSVVFHGGNSKYDDTALSARNVLVSPLSSGGRAWTITDGGYSDF